MGQKFCRGKGNPEFHEAIRLVREFFPETKPYISYEQGLGFQGIITAMRLGEFYEDFSCDTCAVKYTHEPNFYTKGGFDRNDNEAYMDLLEYSGFNVSGRVIIIPDAIGNGSWTETHGNCYPIICSSKIASQRLEEREVIFNGSADSVFVYESGHIIAVDHDSKIFWSKSKQ